VSILAVLDFVGSALMALCGVAFLVGVGTALHAPLLAAMGTIGGVVCLLIAAIPALVGWGLWNLKNWARALTIIFAALGILAALFGFISPDMRLAALFPLIVNGIVAAYLTRDEVRQAFA
jgi:uncharacterized membrane protein (DUF2068 family)